MWKGLTMSTFYVRNLYGNDGVDLQCCFIWCPFPSTEFIDKLIQYRIKNIVIFEWSPLTNFELYNLSTSTQLRCNLLVWLFSVERIPYWRVILWGRSKSGYRSSLRGMHILSGIPETSHSFGDIWSMHSW